MRRAVHRLGCDRLLHDRQGASTVEFAVAVPFFILFLVGIIEVARGCWTVNALQNAVAHTARYASLDGNSKPAAANCTTTTIAAFRTSVMNYLDAELATTLPAATSAVTTPTCPTGGFPTVTLTITASYTYNFSLSTLVPITPIVVQQHAVVSTPLT